jgi:hypothetical protein
MLVNAWQLIFLQSKVNNGTYNGELLPAQNWDWPQETWFQKRLRALRKARRQMLKKIDPPVPSGLFPSQRWTAKGEPTANAAIQ